MKTYIIPLLFLLLSISTSFGQGYDVSEYLPGEPEYALKKVYKVTEKGKPGELTYTYQYDQKGRLQEYRVGDDPELSTRYVYKTTGDGDICRIYDRLGGTGDTVYKIFVVKYDTAHSVTCFVSIEEMPDFIANDTTYVKRTDIVYKGHRQLVTHSRGTSFLKAEELTREYPNMDFRVERKEVIETYKTKDHEYITRISDNKTIYADSTWYKNGKEVKCITVGTVGYKEAETVTDVRVVTTSSYKGNARIMRSAWTYTDEMGKRVQRKPVTGETINNSNGLPIQEFELTGGKRELVKSLEYEYYE